MKRKVVEMNEDGCSQQRNEYQPTNQETQMVGLNSKQSADDRWIEIILRNKEKKNEGKKKAQSLSAMWAISSNLGPWIVFCYNVDEKKNSIRSWGRSVELTPSPHVCIGFLWVLPQPRDVQVRLTGVSASPGRSECVCAWVCPVMKGKYSFSMLSRMRSKHQWWGWSVIGVHKQYEAAFLSCTCSIISVRLVPLTLLDPLATNLYFVLCLLPSSLGLHPDPWRGDSSKAMGN